MDRLLAGVDIAALDDGPGRRAGRLPARSGLADPVDAAVVCLAGDDDDILTSDPCVSASPSGPPRLPGRQTVDRPSSGWLALAARCRKITQAETATEL